MITKDPTAKYRADGSIDVDHYRRKGQTQIRREMGVWATSMREEVIASLRERCDNVAALVTISRRKTA
jgi:hypothetical protein